MLFPKQLRKLPNELEIHVWRSVADKIIPMVKTC